MIRIDLERQMFGRNNTDCRTPTAVVMCTVSDPEARAPRTVCAKCQAQSGQSGCAGGIRDATTLHYDVVGAHVLPARTNVIVHYGHARTLRKSALATSAQKVAGHANVTLKNTFIICRQQDLINDGRLASCPVRWKPRRECDILLEAPLLIVLKKVRACTTFYVRPPRYRVGSHFAAVQKRATVARSNFLGVRYGPIQEGPIGRLRASHNWPPSSWSVSQAPPFPSS